MKSNIPMMNPAPISPGMKDFFSMQQSVESFTRMTDKAFKELFKGEIRGSFLIDVKSKVLQSIAPFMLQLFDLGISEERIATGLMANGSCDFEICKVIIGIHHANCVFLTPEEINEKIKDPDYKEQVIRQAVYHVCLRPYAAAFFRAKTLVIGERFNFYPVPYMTFAMCTRMNEIFRTKGAVNESSALISVIMNKSIAALSLVENGHFDTAYMPCRAVIELYVKLLLLRKHPHLFAEADKFAYFDLQKTNCSREYSDEFNQLFAKRKNQSCRNKVDYMHFGFVDAIEDYHDIVRAFPYSTGGVFTYLKAFCDEEESNVLEFLETMYKACHGYTHANVIMAKYPLLHYFEISMILGMIIPSVYKITCDESGCDQDLYQEMMEYYQKDFALLTEQYLNRTTENFDLEKSKYSYKG